MSKRGNKSTPQLDLYGIKHADVETTVEDFILDKTPPIRIITGNSDPMKKLVKKTLDKHGYEYTDAFHACIMVLS